MREIEHRVVCKYYPQNGHQLHDWNKLNEKAARQSVIDFNHKATVEPGNFYAKCAPFKVQSRPLVEWEDVPE